MNRIALHVVAAAALLGAVATTYAVNIATTPQRLDDTSKAHKERVEKEEDRDSDGKKHVVIAEKDVPAKVLDAVKKAYPGAKIGKIEKETYKDGTVHYEFDLKTDDGKMKEVEFSADGEKLEEN